MYSSSERKLINIFKAFMERIFVPQLPKLDLICQQEWNKFSSLISSQPFNLAEAQLYVDTLPTANSLQNLAKLPDRQENKSPSPLFTKIRKQSSNQSAGFNPLKTFGGQRAKAMFPLKDFDDTPVDRPTYNFSKDFSKDKQQGFNGLTTQVMLPTLERLFKVFNDNQTKIEKGGNTQTVPFQKTYFN